jgi:hypothetical protein
MLDDYFTAKLRGEYHGSITKTYTLMKVPVMPVPATLTDVVQIFFATTRKWNL